MSPLQTILCATLVPLASSQVAELPALLPSEPVPLESYLPGEVSYDAAFPRPESVLGWTVGEWHARHDQVVEWCRRVAEASPRVTLETYGATHEGRPLLLARITSPANHARLDELRRAHVDAVLAGAAEHDGPEVVWLGYGVHGNEPSASNAALVVLYHLAAATGPEIDSFLASTIVLLDPCLNPDGHARFAQWANAHRGRLLVADPAHREHREVWPGGRTNHYWFDLNRDWLLLTHPESRGRVAAFQRWLPCVLTDYHEMGTDSTYFFQPGIPSRVNPLTPAENQRLTGEIARHHAAALDRLGSLYFTQESFDDFYYGKGSTYPDVLGCVGILFEQASARGHVQENSFGGVTFPYAIRNQVATSLSTLAAVDALRAELSAYQRGSFRSALEEARGYEHSAFVFGAEEDPTRTVALAELLHRHGLRVHQLAAEVEVAGTRHVPGRSFVVPVAQPRFRVLRAMFETRTSFEDPAFYDVSAWTLPLSFGVPFGGLPAGASEAELLGAPFAPATRVAAVDDAPAGSTGAAPGTDAQAAPGTAPGPQAVTAEPGGVDGAPGGIGWAMAWPDSAAAPALVRLLGRGVRVRVATDEFTAETTDGRVAFGRGTLLVTRGQQALAATPLREALQEAADLGVPVRTLTSGLTPSGADLGSGSFKPLELPRAVLVVGPGVSAYEAGEVWFELDARLGLPVSLVERDALDDLDLARYTHLLLVSGAEAGWSDALEAKVRAWIRAGGVVVATRAAGVRSAARLLPSRAPAPDVARSPATPDAAASPERLPYATYEATRAVERLAGAIFEVEVDRTHPLAYGLVRPTLAVFRNDTALMPEGHDRFATPARYLPEPLRAGYCSPSNQARIAGTPALRAERLGRGAVVCFADDPLFRGAWQGTRKPFHNALFFARALERTGSIGRAESESEHATALESH